MNEDEIVDGQVADTPVDTPVQDSPDVPDQGATNTPSAEAQRVAELEKALAAKDQEMAGFQDLVSIIKNDPELFNAVKKRLGGEDEESDPVQHAFKVIDEKFQGETAAAMKEVFTVFAEAQARKQRASMEPIAREVAVSAVDNKRAAGLRAAGLDSAALYDKSYADFERAFRAKNPWIGLVEKGDIKQAYTLIGQSFLAEREAQGDAEKHKGRIYDAKLASSLEPRSTRAGKTTDKIVLRKGPGAAREILRLMEERGGAVPDIELR